MMKPSKFIFVKSATKPIDYPQSILPEIAFIGRSNSGKSSLFNALSGQKIAKVSATPGKTQLLNFFEYKTKYFLVDMPGYGYARRPQVQIRNWKNIVETYFKTRLSLKGLILVMDIRRDWTDDESQLLNWLENLPLKQKHIIVVLNKCDKLNNHQKKTRYQKIQKDSQIQDVFVVSCIKKTGIVDLQKHIYKKFLF